MMSEVCVSLWSGHRASFEELQLPSTGQDFRPYGKKANVLLKTPIQYTNAYIWNLERW